jgi:hypothetical protein
VLPELRLAAADAAKNLLDLERLTQIRNAVAEIIDETETHEDLIEKVATNVPDPVEASPLSHLQSVESAIPVARPLGMVLCLPGQGLLDEATCMMIAHLLARRGVASRVESARALSMSRLSSWNTDGVGLICLCYVETVSSAQIRYAIRRIRRKSADINIVVTLLSDNFEISDHEIPEGINSVHATTAAAIDKILSVANEQPIVDSKETSQTNLTKILIPA